MAVNLPASLEQEIDRLHARLINLANISGALQPYGLEAQEYSLLTALWSKPAGLYDYYPDLFAEAFPRIHNNTALEDLAFSARLFSNALILNDRIVDESCSTHPYLLSEANRMLIAGTQLLGHHFPWQSPFWNYFNVFFHEYSHAVAQERKNHFRSWAPYSIEELKTIACGKSALGKYVIAGLGVLANAEDRIDSLATSHDLYYIGYQIFDDLRDWKDDFAKGNYTRLLVRAVEHYQAQESDTTVLPSQAELAEVIYTSGLLQECLALADQYFEYSIDAMGEYSCVLWQEVIRDTQDRCACLCSDLQEIVLQQQLQQQKHTLVPLWQARNMTTPPRMSEKSTVEIAKQAALDFLLLNQSPEGCWQDFYTEMGTSSEWVTAYVGLALSEHGNPCQLELETARDWLQKRRRRTGGWGYNAKVNVDLDSTANGLLFMQTMRTQYSHLEDDLQILLAHQDNASGGFSTYLPHALHNSNGKGWCLPDNSVSAIAALVLFHCGSERFSQQIRQVAAYLADQQNAEGYWHSYWWNGTMYSTTLALQALHTIGRHPAFSSENHLTVLEKGLKWMLETQRPDGSWEDFSSTGGGQPFATALAAHLLLSIDATDEVVGCATKRAIGWLVTNQLEDGSWFSHPIMRVPDPTILTPWDPGSFLPEKLKMSEDRHRVFTTATVLKALTRFAS